MIIARHRKQDTLVVLATDRGLPRPMMRQGSQPWSVAMPNPESLARDFQDVDDGAERERAFDEALAAYWATRI